MQLQAPTPNGTVFFTVRAPPEGERPAVVVIGGLWPKPDQFHWLIDALPAHDVLVARLPGMHCPALPVNTVEAITEAFEHALATLLGERRRAVVGVSTGCLVAAGLRADFRFLSEPFFHTGASAILTEKVLLELRDEPAGSANEAYFAQLLGVTRGDQTGLDFTALAARISEPTVVLFGGMKERGPDGAWPSLTTKADLRALAARGARIRGGLEEFGHGIASRPIGRAETIERLTEALAALES